MIITGEWYLCDDGLTRPVVRAEVRAAQGSMVKAPLLVDTGADRTVLSADVFAALGVRPIGFDHQLGGVGGLVTAVIIPTQIRLLHAGGGRASFQGDFAALSDPAALDMSVLGRDITRLFALIVDRPGEMVCLLRERHRYTIQQS